ncbi:hypothetical protein PLESTF_001612700 [Pleodorina starrii]|nr:hypothetical protein PLESTF_001612700 [Pleodorina starrii]
MDMIQDDVIRTAVLQIYAVASRDTQTRPADQANQQQARDTADSGDNGEPVDSLAPSTNDLIHSSLYLLMVAVLPLWQTASFRNPPPSPSRWPPTVISGFMRLLLRMQSFKPISQRLAAGVAEARELLRELATGEAESGAGGTVEGTAAVAAVVAEAAAPTAAPEPAAPLRRANAEELVRLLVSELTKTPCCMMRATPDSTSLPVVVVVVVSYIADLAGALADSHILEHTARAAVTALELVGATAAAGETGEAAGGAAGKAADDRTAVELEALAGRLVRWGAGEQGSEGNGTVAAATRLSQLEVGVLRALASPSEMAAVLRTCANPVCVNFEGDSDAGLRLAACGRCGAAWYCCRDCQTAHWRTGHRAECSGGAATATAAGARAATGLAEGD